MTDANNKVGWCCWNGSGGYPLDFDEVDKNAFYVSTQSTFERKER